LPYIVAVERALIAERRIYRVFADAAESPGV
jgi:hypothetical protein